MSQSVVREESTAEPVGGAAPAEDGLRTVAALALPAANAGELRANLARLRRRAQTLKQDGIHKVLGGTTDLPQVLAVTQR